MCGILEISLNENLTINKSNFLKSLSLLNHRGPDDEGYLLIAILLDKRLSIIDLSKGMYNQCFRLINQVLFVIMVKYIIIRT